MEKNNLIKVFETIYKAVLGVFLVVIMLLAGVIYLHFDPALSAFASADTENNTESTQLAANAGPAIVDGIHVETGLKEGEGLQTVIATCTACHSAKLVTQNRATKEGWVSMIRWMQETQNLWDLGESEEIIVNYLATNYAPEKKGRRQNLKEIEWYELD